MAVTWTIKSKLLNEDTGLRKITATRKNDVSGSSYSITHKARTKTPTEQKAAKDAIFAKYQAAKVDAVADKPFADSLKADLEAGETP